MISRRTLYVGAAGVIALVAIWSTMSTTTKVAAPAAPSSPQEEVLELGTPTAAPVDMSTPVPELSPPVSSTESFTYALPLDELAGLDPRVPPGTEIEIWVAWEPPITKTRRIQKLVSGVQVDEIAPPVTTEGAPVAILRLDRRGIERLFWGDRYGALSAVVVASS